MILLNQSLKILLLFIDFHYFAGWNIFRIKCFVGASLGHQQWCFGQCGVVFYLLCPSVGLHQMENRGESAVEEVVACDGCYSHLVRFQLVVDYCAHAFVRPTFCSAHLRPHHQCGIKIRSVPHARFDGIIQDESLSICQRPD